MIDSVDYSDDANSAASEMHLNVWTNSKHQAAGRNEGHALSQINQLEAKPFGMTKNIIVVLSFTKLILLKSTSLRVVIHKNKRSTQV